MANKKKRAKVEKELKKKKSIPEPSRLPKKAKGVLKHRNSIKEKKTKPTTVKVKKKPVAKHEKDKIKPVFKKTLKPPIKKPSEDKKKTVQKPERKYKKANKKIIAKKPVGRPPKSKKRPVGRPLGSKNVKRNNYLYLRSFLWKERKNAYESYFDPEFLKVVKEVHRECVTNKGYCPDEQILLIHDSINEELRITEGVRQEPVIPQDFYQPKQYWDIPNVYLEEMDLYLWICSPFIITGGRFDVYEWQRKDNKPDIDNVKTRANRKVYFGKVYETYFKDWVDWCNVVSREEGWTGGQNPYPPFFFIFIPPFWNENDKRWEFYIYPCDEEGYITDFGYSTNMGIYDEFADKYPHPIMHPAEWTPENAAPILPPDNFPVEREEISEEIEEAEIIPSRETEEQKAEIEEKKREEEEKDEQRRLKEIRIRKAETEAKFDLLEREIDILNKEKKEAKDDMLFAKKELEDDELFQEAKKRYTDILERINNIKSELEKLNQ